MNFASFTCNWFFDTHTPALSVYKMSLVPSSTSSPISLDQLLYNGSQISSQTWYSLSSVENSLKETVAICKDSIAYRVDQTNQLLVSVPSKKEPQQIYLQTHDIS